MKYAIRILALALVGCTPSPVAPPPAPVTPPGPVPTPDAVPHLLLVSHNAARRLASRPALEWDGRLAASAQAHADFMAKRGVLAHDGIGDGTPWDRMRSAGYAFAAAAEDAATGATTETRVMADWMADPPHRANVLGPYRDMGAGVAVDARGVRWWCVDFGTPSGVR